MTTPTSFPITDYEATLLLMRVVAVFSFTVQHLGIPQSANETTF